jgi:hypothetical protein
MAIRARPSSTRWWPRFAEKVHRSPEDVAEIMSVAARTPNPYPHVRLRLVLEKSEAYLPETGLAVWEVAWLGHVYGGNVSRVAEHLSIAPWLVEEALQYAKAHSSEISSALAIMEEGSEARLRGILPGIRVVEVDMESDGEQSR